MEHKLKILPQYFKAVQSGEKTFEIRKNDRGYEVGDTLLLQEWKEEILLKTAMNTMSKGHYTGQEITKEISYIYEGEDYGLKKSWCVLGLKEPIENISNCTRCGRTIVNFEECDCKVEYFQKGLILKNIDLTGISEFEQTQKVMEEENEFAEAYCNYINNKTKENKKHWIEELYDEFQSKLGLLEKEGIKAEEVMSEYPKHLNKLEKRGNKPRLKKCIKCLNKADCRLYLSEHFQGQQEAETCKKYLEKEDD